MILLSHNTKINLLFSAIFLLVIAGIANRYFALINIHIGYISAVYTIFIIIILLPSIRINKLTLLPIILIGFLTFAAFINASDIRMSLYTLSQYALSLVMLPLAYSLIGTKENIIKVHYMLLVILILLLINFFIAQVYELGSAYYVREGGVYTGGGGVQQSYLLVYIILATPFLLLLINRNKNKDVYLLLSGIAILPVLLIGRRGAILALFIGIVIYIIIMTDKRKVIKLLIASSVILFVLSPIYTEQFLSVYETRIQHTERDIELRGGRFQEVQESIKILMDEGILKSMIGVDLFNYPAYSGQTRQQHVDYAVILFGGGFIGIALYILFHVVLVKHFFKMYKVLKHTYSREILAIFLSFIAAFLLISFSGQYYVVSSLTLFYFYIGSMFGFLENEVKKTIASRTNNYKAGNYREYPYSYTD